MGEGLRTSRKYKAEERKWEERGVTKGREALASGTVGGVFSEGKWGSLDGRSQCCLELGSISKQRPQDSRAPSGPKAGSQ